MADRSVVVRLRAEIGDFKRQMAEAAKATDKLPESAKRAETSLGRMVQSAEHNRESWDRAGASLTAFGVASLAGLGLATKAALDWESAWTGVLKTVDGSDAELAQLEADLRQMARTLPASHQEIAAVAEAAGQLGVQTENVAAFTRVMVDLGETTNLTADEAATSIAQLMNVMQTAPADVDNLGAALVQLGNNGASTERDIVFMAQRIAGAGKIVGLSEGEVLGLANALASVGIEVEAGGTAISKIMTDIAKSVATNSADLELWAQVADMTTTDFAAAFRNDPADAIASFVEGLGRVNEAGGDVFTTLDDLGQSDVRVSRALLTMANSGDLLRESLEQGNTAWEDNTALVAEAAKRYDTGAARLEMARGAINDTAITLGETFLPVLADAADGVAGFATWVGALPDPVLRAGAGLTGLAGGAALVGGAFLLTFPRVMDTVQAFRELRTVSPGVATGISKVGRAAGAAGAAAAVGLLAASLVDMIPSGERAALSVEETTSALLGLSDVDMFAISGQITDVGSAMDALVGGNLLDRLNRFGKSLDDALGFEIMGDLHAAEDQFLAIGQALATMVEQGQSGRAAEQFAVLARDAVDAGYSVDELKSLMPDYVASLANAENQATLTGDAQNALTGEYQATGEVIGAQIPTLEELIDLQAQAAGVVLSERDAQRGLQQAIDDATASLTEHGKTLDITTQEGRDNAAALDGIADSSWSLIDAMRENGATQDELQTQTAASRQAFIDAAVAMGMGAEDAERLADEMGLIPEKVAVAVSVETSAAEARLAAFRQLLQMPDVRIGVDVARSGYYANRAEGGIVYGPGTATSDSISARLSNGEYVIKTAAVNRYGKAMFDDLNAMRFATGGYVGAAPTTAPPAPAAALPDTVRLDRASVLAVADAIVAGAERVSAGALAGAARDAGGRRSTRGASWS